jgi:hypothetical protein
MIVDSNETASMVVYNITMKELQDLKGRPSTRPVVGPPQSLESKHAGVTSDGFKIYYYDPDFLTLVEEVRYPTGREAFCSVFLKFLDRMKYGIRF